MVPQLYEYGTVHAWVDWTLQTLVRHRHRFCQTLANIYGPSYKAVFGGVVSYAKLPRILWQEVSVQSESNTFAYEKYQKRKVNIAVVCDAWHIDSKWCRWWTSNLYTTYTRMIASFLTSLWQPLKIPRLHFAARALISLCSAVILSYLSQSRDDLIQ